MGILQWIKKVFRISNKAKQLEEPKTISKNDNWKDSYKQSEVDSIVEKKLILEEKRKEQIKLIEHFILYKAENLLKEEICEEILKNYDKNILDNTDMQTLIILYKATKIQDMYGDSEIRHFIEDGQYNIVKLVAAENEAREAAEAKMIEEKEQKEKEEFKKWLWDKAESYHYASWMELAEKIYLSIYGELPCF